jgi:uncharacterized protein YndB with AHSA1/START domain
MTVIESRKDTGALNFTIVAEFEAGVERVWQVWADPRQLERWWGPPTWPATFEDHEFQPGGRASYYMTGPEGEKARGWWRFVAVDEPSSLEFDDGFSDESGEPDPNMPVTRARVALEPIPTGTRMTITSQFATLEQMEQLVQMGMQEGMTLAMEQMDAILAED